jgi:hypothetical protein
MNKLFKSYKVGKKPVKKYKARKPAAKAITQIVTRVLDKKIETKTIQYYTSKYLSDYYMGAYGGVANTMTVLSLSPNDFSLPIGQATGQAGRIGNKIQTKKLMFRGMFHTRRTSTDLAPCAPQLVKMWILYQKGTAYGDIDPTLPGFFQQGFTSMPPTGSVTDDFFRVNRDKYNVFATRTFKVAPQVQPMTDPVLFPNNDFKYSQSFAIDCTNYCIKNMVYNDANTQPNVRGLYCIVESIAADNTIGNNSQFPTQMHYELSYDYHDA